MSTLHVFRKIECSASLHTRGKESVKLPPSIRTDPLRTEQKMRFSRFKRARTPQGRPSRGLNCNCSCASAKKAFLGRTEVASNSKVRSETQTGGLQLKGLPIWSCATCIRNVPLQLELFVPPRKRRAPPIALPSWFAKGATPPWSCL